MNYSLSLANYDFEVIDLLDGVAETLQHMRKKLCIRIVNVCLFLLLLNSCGVIKNRGFNAEDTDFVEICRQNWTYLDLQNTVTIRLLHQDEKGHYDLVNWPNLFIGVTNQNDTVGVIDNFTTKEYDSDIFLTFSPYDYGTDIEKSFTGLKPVFRVHRKDKINRLYCSVVNLYYGKLVDE